MQPELSVIYGFKLSQNHGLELSHPDSKGIIAEASVEVPARIAERWPSEGDIRAEGEGLLGTGDCPVPGSGSQYGIAVSE